MLEAIKTITVYNRYEDKARDCEPYQRTVIRGVSVFDKTTAAVTEKGLTSADSVVIRIPASAAGKYRPPEEWSPGNGWTLQEGDVIALKESGFEVTGLKPYTLSELRRQARCVTVMSVGDNRRGPRRLRHIRVGGA